MNWNLYIKLFVVGIVFVTAAAASPVFAVCDGVHFVCETPLAGLTVIQ